MEDIRARIEREVAGWEGVTTAPHRFGGVEFRLGNRELGHLHGDRLADLPFVRTVRDMLVDTGRAIAALASDPNVLAKSGRVYTTPALAREYGFTDVDGKQQSAFWDEHWAGA